MDKLANIPLISPDSVQYINQVVQDFKIIVELTNKAKYGQIPEYGKQFIKNALSQASIIISKVKAEINIS